MATITKINNPADRARLEIELAQAARRCVNCLPETREVCHEQKVIPGDPIACADAVEEAKMA